MSEIINTHSVEETLRIQTLKLNQQLNKLLEQNTRILQLEAERDALAAQYRSCSVSKTIHRAPVTARLSKLQRIKDAS
jgi:hypothetical protein